VKRVFFVRHGHGEHNGAAEDALAAGLGLSKACLAGGAIRDPGLTPKGVGQCQALASDPILQKALAARAGRAEVVVVSPCKRTLQTATIGLADAGLPFVACAECQECADLPSDTGRPVSDLKPEFPMVDFSAIERPLDWFEKVGPYDFAKMAVKPEGRLALLDRCARFTAFIAARLAMGGEVIKCPSPLNVLKDTCDHSCY
jgi:broad specificity phosphatase PhoE